MKEDRNCGSAYPVYPMYGGMQGIPGPLPMGGVNMPMPMPMGSPTPYGNMVGFDNVSYGSASDSSLSQQINSLEQRITNLENMLNNSSYSSTSYNSTNYQMM